jgi:hypothetical protein
VKEENVERDTRSLVREPGQEVEGAHHKSEGEDRHRGAHEEKHLLVQPELRLAEAPHEQERQRDAEGKGHGLRAHEPEGAPGE